MTEDVPDWVWVEKRFEYNEYLWRLDKSGLIQIINGLTNKLNNRELEITEEEERELLNQGEENDQN